ncbi:MAG: hypothetical protein KME59_15835 [Trichormus sp. ATA11-4-KO1]|jgi:hypothetical protein|nr:hypothetical protein [Trichormus sp. ATA11-4-KO1]
MTTSVTDKTPIPTKVWRRHTDPPSLWIAVAVSSLSLHLLVFWLMRSSNVFTPWFPQQSQAIVPIEFIEISPEAESTKKSNLPTQAVSPQPPIPEKSNLQTQAVSPQPQISPQQSAPELSSETAPTRPNNQNTDATNSDASLPNESKTEASQPNTQIFREKIASEPGFTPTPTPTPTPTIPVGELPWNRRQEVLLGKGQPLPTDIPSIPSEQPEVAQAKPGETANIPSEETAPTPTGETANILSEETAPTPTGETANIPSEETAPTPTGETASTPTDGGAIAKVAPLADNEVRQLIQEGRLSPDGLPDVLAVYEGSNIKQLDLSYLASDSALQPAQFLASLVIDKNGNFQQAKVLEIEPVRLQSAKNLYEEVVNDIFRNDNFLPAHNNDGTKPDLSNVFVRITIQPARLN